MSTSETDRTEPGRPWLVPGLLCVTVGLVHLWCNQRLASPIAQPDEAGYLGNATQIVRGFGNTGDGYSAGYSLLLIPAELVTTTRYGFYRAALATNAVLGMATPLLAYFLARTTFPSLRRTTAGVVALLVALGPTVFVVNGTAMSENLLVPLTLALALAIARAVERDTPSWWVLVGGLGGLAYWANPRGLIVTACVLLAALLAVRRRAALTGAVLALVALGGLALNRAVGGSDRVAGVTGREEGLIPVLAHPSKWPDWIRLMSGRVAYAGVATIGVAIVAMLVAFTWARRGTVAQRGLAVFAAATVLATIALDAAAATGIDFARLDYVYYGRYLDGVIAPLLVIGLGWMAAYTPSGEGGARGVAEQLVLPVVVGGVIVASALIARTYTPDLPMESSNVFNVLGLYGITHWVDPRSMTGVLLVGALVATIAVAAMIWSRAVALGIVAIALAAAAWPAFDDYLQPGSVSRAEEGVIADHVNRLVDEGLGVPCIVATEDASFFHRNHYKFLLPEVRIITLENVEFDEQAGGSSITLPRTAETDRCPLWLAPSDAPLPPSAFHLVSVENNAPIALWLRDDAPGADTITAMGLAFAADPCTALPPARYGAWLTVDGANLTVTNRSGSPWIGGNAPYPSLTDACGQAFVTGPGGAVPIPRTLLPGEAITFPSGVLEGAEPDSLAIELRGLTRIAPTPPPATATSSTVTGSAITGSTTTSSATGTPD